MNPEVNQQSSTFTIITYPTVPAQLWKEVNAHDSRSDLRILELVWRSITGSALECAGLGSRID